MLGELHDLKYITFGLNNSLFVKNATFHSLSFLICILLYLQMRSNLLKYLASLSLLITSPIKSSNILSFIVG